MKSKLIALVLVLFTGAALLTITQLPSDAQAQTPKHRLVISEYGTVLDVIDVDGKSRVGRLRLDGFQVSYKTNGKKKSVSAFGAANVQGLQPGQVKDEGESTSVTVITKDGTLAITSYFSLDESTNRLTIRRSFRNLSSSAVDSFVASQYVDPRLISSEQFATQKELTQKALVQIMTGGDPNDCGLKECTPDRPPCVQQNCPPEPIPQPSLSLRATPVGRQIILRWPERALTKISVDASPTQANEAHQVTQLDLIRD